MNWNQVIQLNVLYISLKSFPHLSTPIYSLFWIKLLTLFFFYWGFILKNASIKLQLLCSIATAAFIWAFWLTPWLTLGLSQAPPGRWCRTSSYCRFQQLDTARALFWQDTHIVVSLGVLCMSRAVAHQQVECGFWILLKGYAHLGGQSQEVGLAF